MTLGQNIARLRAEKRMSQGELADALDVSRQSVSKWETDASVPELEKLVKLSALFDVSLDELVNGEREEKVAVEPQLPAAEEKKAPLAAQRTIGVVFLALGTLLLILLTVLGSFAGGFIFGLPFFICGLLCLLCKKPVALWCSWVLYLCADSYFRYATGLTWRTVLHTHLWQPSMNYMRLFVGWCQFLVMLLMIFCTLRAYRGFVPKKNSGKLLAALWAIYAALCFLPSLIRRKLVASMGAQAFFDAYYNHSALGSAVDVLLSYLCLALLCVLLVRTRAWWKAKKEEKKDC